jgi:5-methylcytosine-specific restriction endonuclease McrA
MSVRRHGHRPSLRLHSASVRRRPTRKRHKGGITHFRGARYKRAIKRATMRDCSRRCVYCATALDFETATLDHVYPLAHGGAHAPGNVVLACTKCNRLKSDLLPTHFFMLHPWAGSNFMRYARAVHRGLKRAARRAVSLAYAEAA